MIITSLYHLEECRFVHNTVFYTVTDLSFITIKQTCTDTLLKMHIYPFSTSNDNMLLTIQTWKKHVVSYIAVLKISIHNTSCIIRPKSETELPVVSILYLGISSGVNWNPFITFTIGRTKYSARADLKATFAATESIRA